MKIKVTQKGNGFDKLEAYLKKVPKRLKGIDFDAYGKKGVEALAAATPKDTGKTSESWDYRITKKNGSISIEWFNTNPAGKTNMSVAYLLVHGHGTASGAYVAGRNFVSPALEPIFDDLAKEIEEEVKRKW